MEPSLILKSHIVRTITSSFSCVASIAIAVMILTKARGEGSNPYQRFLLALSIADIIQTLSIIIGPFATPQDTPNTLWSRGNTYTCEGQGFFMDIAFMAIPMYTLGLNVYFLLRVKCGMTREKFAKKIERKWHASVLLFNIICNSFAVFNGNINATDYGSLCTIESYPLHCRIDPQKYGECTRGKKSRLVGAVTIYVPLMICFVGIITTLCMLTWHVFMQQTVSTYEPPPAANRRTTDLVTQRPAAARYRREILTQSCLYTFGFFFTYSAILIRFVLRITNRPLLPWTHVANSIAWPIGGLINILIYTRPKITILRIRQSELSWLRAFYMVILAGAEVPDEVASVEPDMDNSTNVKQFSDLRSKHEKLANAETSTNDDKEEGKLRGAGSVVDSFFNREREDVILAEISSNLAQQPWSMQLMDTSELEQSSDMKSQCQQRYNHYSPDKN